MTAMARLTALLFAMWVGVTVSTVVDLEKRVIGGQVCDRDERQYHVQLTTSDGKFESSCGGSLISLNKHATQSQWILTAAHCVKKGWKVTAHIGVHPGNHHREVKITDPHRKFRRYLKKHDLMLLKLPDPVDIKPIELPDCQHPPKIGAKVQIAGDGSTQVGPNNERIPGSSTTLQCADMKIVDCQTYIDYLRVTVKKYYDDKKHQHWICTNSPSVDACCGDSGGGVVYQNKIYGVMQSVHPTIVSGYPLASMDLCYPPYLKWIKATIKP